MQLCRRVDADETERIAETKSQNSRVRLHPCAEIEVFQCLKLQASAQADALALGVFLDFTLPDEVLRELISCTETEHDGQLFLVETWLQTKTDRIENVCAKSQFFSNLLMNAQLKGDGTLSTVCVALANQ